MTQKNLPIKWGMTVLGGADRPICVLLPFPMYPTHGGLYAKLSP